MPPRRKASGDADTAASSKKFRSAIDETVAEFVCPISQELPLECTAEPPDDEDTARANAWLSCNSDVVSTWQC